MSADVVARSIDRIEFDHAVSLHTDRGTLRIESDLQVAVGADAPVQVAIVELASAGGPLLTLLHRNVELIRAEDDGSLRVRAGEVTLTVAPHPTFEAWSWAGTDGARVVCGPGGQLSTWGPETEPSG